MNITKTDCRSEEGITVGLIDSIISISRILAKRDLTTPEVLEALKDLRQDEDVAKVIPHPKLNRFNMAYGRARCNGCNAERPTNVYGPFPHAIGCPLKTK